MDETSNSAAYLRQWAADIRKSSGQSVDADRLDGIAEEIEHLRQAGRKDVLDAIEGFANNAERHARDHIHNDGTALDVRQQAKLENVERLQAWLAHVRTKFECP